MGGNLWEWNEGIAGGSRVRRGGYWNNLSDALQSSLRLTDSPDYELYHIGFRVASVSLSVVPEPSSVGLLVIGALGCVMRRKRG